MVSVAQRRALMRYHGKIVTCVDSTVKCETLDHDADDYVAASKAVKTALTVAMTIEKVDNADDDDDDNDGEAGKLSFCDVVSELARHLFPSVLCINTALFAAAVTLTGINAAITYFAVGISAALNETFTHGTPNREGLVVQLLVLSKFFS
jgi:hypothetical protein